MAPERGEKDESLWVWQRRLVLAAVILICAMLPFKTHDIFALESWNVGIHYRQSRGLVEFVKRGGLSTPSFLSTDELIELFNKVEKTHLLFTYHDFHTESRYLLESENDMISLSSSLLGRKKAFIRRRLIKMKNDDDIFDEDIDARVERPSQKPYFREIFLIGDSLLSVPELFFNISHMSKGALVVGVSENSKMREMSTYC